MGVAVFRQVACTVALTLKVLGVVAEIAGRLKASIARALSPFRTSALRVQPEVDRHVDEMVGWKTVIPGTPCKLNKQCVLSATRYLERPIQTLR